MEKNASGPSSRHQHPAEHDPPEGSASSRPKRWPARSRISRFARMHRP